MDIKRCRRILIVGAPDCDALNVIQDLAGSSPTKHESGSIAGLSHEWNVKTAYYKATVPIWVDEIADVSEWKAEFLKPEAKEVIDAVGAWIYCFRAPHDGSVNPHIESTMDAIKAVVEEHAEYGNDTVMLAVAGPKLGEHLAIAGKSLDEWEDVCLEHGFELINYTAKGRNEYGEKQGFERLKEALEANEWASSDNENEQGFGDLEDDQFGDFSTDEAAMTAELYEMKAALIDQASHEPGDEQSTPAAEQESAVEDLDVLMGRLLAVREQTADLPEAQRKRKAALAVRELMQQHSS